MKDVFSVAEYVDGIYLRLYEGDALCQEIEKEEYEEIISRDEMEPFGFKFHQQIELLSYYENKNLK